MVLFQNFIRSAKVTIEDAALKLGKSNVIAQNKLVGYAMELKLP
jgi:hypothetical protein